MDSAQLAAGVKASIKAGLRQSETNSGARRVTDESKEESLRLKVELVIVQIPTRVQIAARKDQAYAEVMEVRGEDHDGSWFRTRSSVLDPFQPQWLREKAKRVYDFCQQAGLKPEIHAITKNGEDYNPVIVVPSGGKMQNRARAGAE